MDKESIVFAKLAGVLKNFQDINWGPLQKVFGSRVEHLMQQYNKYSKELMELLPDLYGDLPIIEIPNPEGKNSENETIYLYRQIIPIIRSIDYIFEVRANYRIDERINSEERPKRVFISHGQSKEWYKVQMYIEKDLQLMTLELTQEANQGRTILQKLNEEASKCSSAVIVMTGDDIFGNDTRARENVMHEIGFFQGKYGLHNVILLHEEGTNIPSNIQGLVYIPFPNNLVDSTLGALTRELKVIYN